MIKKVLIFIGICFVIGASIGTYEWFKPHQKVEDKTSVALTASALCKMYSADEKKADSLYNSKTNAIDVSGEVGKTSIDQDGFLSVSLKSDDAMTTEVDCTMRDKGVTVKVGDHVVIRGNCSGLLMGGVLLTDCVLKKN